MMLYKLQRPQSCEEGYKINKDNICSHIKQTIHKLCFCSSYNPQSFSTYLNISKLSLKLFGFFPQWNS